MKKFSLIAGLFFPFALMAQEKLTLEEAVKIAMENNYDIKIAKNAVEIGVINNNWATAGAFPVVGATANKTFASNNLQQNLSNGTTTKTNGAVTQNLNAGLSASWTFFNGFRFYATKRRLAELEKIGEINFKRMTNATLYDVILGYFNIIRLKQQTIAINEVIKLYEERLKIADMKYKIGSSAKTDFLQAQIDLNEQRNILVGIGNDIAVAKTDLNRLMARDPNTPFDTEDSFKLKKQVDISSVQQKIETQNPDLLLEQRNLAVLIQTKKEINADRLPSVTLGANYNFVRSKNAAGFTLLNQTYGPSVSLGVVVPIFNGGIVRRQLKVADINIKNQNLTISQLKNKLQADLTTALLNYNNGLKLVDLETKNLVLVRENNFITQERFRKLNITAIELRQSQINYTDAQTRLINALYQAKVAEADLLLLSGELAE